MRPKREIRPLVIDIPVELEKEQVQVKDLTLPIILEEFTHIL